MVTTNTERVRAGIKRDIVAGELRPGSTLDEAGLGQLYQVSRTPVREALLQLAAEGYVRIMPRAGIYVVQLTAAELMEMCETLAYSEGLCAKLASQRMTPGQLKRMAQLQEFGAKALAERNTDAYAHYNLSFHECLYTGGGNRYLRRQILHIRKRVNPYRQLNNADAPDWTGSVWQHHQKLFEALQARDGDAAMAIAIEFIIWRVAELSELVETSPDHLFFGAGGVLSSDPGRTDNSALFKPLSAANSAA